jgi:uncharacterized protein (DUF1501 family)
MFNRRVFLRGLSSVALGSSQLLVSRTFAQQSASKTLVFIFLRGAADGLSLVPPIGDRHYAELRPSIALSAPGSGPNAALKLDAMFGLHPALGPLKPWFESRKLSFIQATGQLKPSRSHFDAQDFLEGGIPGQKASDGFLNRASQTLTQTSVFQSIALQNSLPYSLSGLSPALAFSSLKDFRIGSSAVTAKSFESLYESAVDQALKGAGHEAFQGLSLAKRTDLLAAPARNGAEYPKSQFAARLQDIARLIHGQVGLKIAVTELGGFDTHLGQGAATGPLAKKCEELSQALAALATDLGDSLQNTCLVCATEFGRTAKENGTKGTDHGTASAALVLGGGHRGGRVISDWPSLAPSALYEGRDLKVTTDIRHVLSECLENTLGISGDRVFPDYQAQRIGLFG